MKKRNVLKLLLTIEIMSFSSSAMPDQSGDILALQIEIKNLKTSIENLGRKLTPISSSKEIKEKARNREKRRIIGNTSCYNLRKNPKVKEYKPGDNINIDAGEYLLCGILNYEYGFFKEGDNKFDFILFYEDLNSKKEDLLRFSEAGSTYKKKFRYLNSIQGGTLNYRIYSPTPQPSYYYSSSPSYASRSYALYNYSYTSSEGLVTLYILNINDF